MEIITYHDSDRRSHWLGELRRSDQPFAAFLRKLLESGDFFPLLGERSRLLLLTDGDELVSFCTYAERDDIPDTDLTPWIGFVYTYPERRGHRYAGLLLAEGDRLAKAEGVSEVYLSTNHVGLYEKYGFEFRKMMTDVHGEPSRIYAKKII